MTPDPLTPKPTSQVYVAVDPSSVVEFKADVAFTTTGGGPQSANSAACMSGRQLKSSTFYGLQYVMSDWL